MTVMGESGGGPERDRATIAPDARWLTYQEIAGLLGMKVESARRRAQREDWPRQLGNDGRTRVAVPGDVVAEEAASGATDAGDDHPDEAEVLRELVATLRDQLAKAEAQAQRERQ